MKSKPRQSGLTLIEMTVVIMVVALLVTFSMPSVRALFKSFEFQSGGKPMISSALAAARAIAAKEQRYAGIRFQSAYRTKGCLMAPQYMIFIVYEEPRKMGNLSNGFRAVEGIEPVKLPESIGVMDLRVRTSVSSSSNDRPIAESDLDDANPVNLDIYGNNKYVTDTTTFSVIFSPTGKLVVHDVRVRNKDGKYQPNPSESDDDIFNSTVNVVSYSKAMFIQDDYPEFGLGEEPSRRSFVIYDKSKLAQMNAAERYKYLHSLDVIYLNPYTGTVINK